MSISLLSFFGAVLTIGSRLTGMMLFAPFFASMAVPGRVKAMLVVALTALLYPVEASKIPVLSIGQWPLMLCCELMIGSGVGIATNLVFDGVQMAGELLSVQMGFSLVNILNPQTQVESTVVATFHQMIAMLIYLQLNVHLWILRGLARSFDYLPPAVGHFRAGFVTATLHAGASVFAIGVQIAAPVLCATMFADVALGLLGKASAQLPLLLLGPAVKTLLGLGILICVLKYWPDQFERLFLNSIQTADHILHLAA